MEQSEMSNRLTQANFEKSSQQFLAALNWSITISDAQIVAEQRRERTFCLERIVCLTKALQNGNESSESLSRTTVHNFAGMLTAGRH
jgi:hypothetical protein